MVWSSVEVAPPPVLGGGVLSSVIKPETSAGVHTSSAAPSSALRRADVFLEAAEGKDEDSLLEGTST